MYIGSVFNFEEATQTDDQNKKDQVLIVSDYLDHKTWILSMRGSKSRSDPIRFDFK